MLIGLTGGIASGKSTVARFLAERGAAVIDADSLGHRAYEPDTPAFRAVVAAFGAEIVGEDGRIDRRRLGARVFNDPAELTRLTDIVWPEIRRLALEDAEKIRAERPETPIVLEAAVLLEAGWEDMVDEVWVVLVEPEVAIARLASRDGLDREQALARIRSQMSNAERAAQARVQIDNSGSEVDLRAELDRCWSELPRRAPAE